MRFVVYGAGAVGGVLGGLLALSKQDVLLVCRSAHAAAIADQNGLRMKSATGEYFAAVEATSQLQAEMFQSDSVVFFTPKSNDTPRAVEALAEVAPRDVPIVTFQNGVENEDIIAEFFENVFGGVCMMTCSFLHPGQVSFRKIGRLVVGKHPKGANPLAKKMVKVLDEAGFDAAASNSVTCDKWLKLAVNLQSAFNAIIEPRDHETNEFTMLKVGVLEEAVAVLAAAKIKAKSCDGRDASIDEIIGELRKPQMARSASAVKVNNSTWQNLYLKRNGVENAFFHEPILRLGRKHDIAVPFNKVALQLVEQSSREGLGPGAFRASDVLAMINKGP